MESQIIIPRRQHIRAFVLETLFFIFMLCLCLPRILYSQNKEANLLFFKIFCSIVVIAYIIISIYYRKWEYPVKLTIKDDSIVIDVMFLYIFKRRYNWKKEYVKIEIKYYPGSNKFRTIIISVKDMHNGIQFGETALKSELFDQILDSLMKNGYEIAQRTYR
ncbi:hypothetical protein SAMN06298215_1701 [Bacteroidales bacterium WCE2008]|nr:hypothetical protein SAMN06298215_1701 [Bacteroidales bacterium WCE2008]